MQINQPSGLFIIEGNIEPHFILYRFHMKERNKEKQRKQERTDFFSSCK